MRKKYKMKFVVLLIISMIVLFSGCSNEKGELSKLRDKKLITSVNSSCEKYFNQKNFVGMSVAIIKDGKIAYLNYGKKGIQGEEVSENTLFEVASLSKPFAGTLLALENLRGTVSLDDPVQRYASYLSSGEYKGSVMTLKHLATHSSGLPRMPRNWHDGPNPYKNYTRKKLGTFLQKNVLTKKPGTVYQYSNLAFGLLGCILEDVKGSSYEEILKTNILDPLDMKSTAIFLDDELQKRKALPYSTGHTEGYEWDFDALQACAGLKSSTRDLARFIAANLGQLECSEELKSSFELARKVHYRGKVTMGLGWRSSKVKGKNIYEHDGQAGGYTSYYAFDLENRVGVVVLCNSGDGVIGLGTSLMEILMSENDN